MEKEEGHKRENLVLKAKAEVLENDLCIQLLPPVLLSNYGLVQRWGKNLSVVNFVSIVGILL